ncbi:MAG: hypothetical protein EAZ08_02320 [Cytophagales bacterium]|nr:MAG: hypothetical protein EAZ08_02320 [Cytophagales bacterium]
MQNFTKLILALICGLFIVNIASAAEFVIKGIYNGKNLYIHNPHNEDEDFCITEFYVNGVRFTAPKSSAIDVDLSHLLAETNVTIKVIHTEVCEPKLMNMNVLRKNQEFHFSAVEFSKNQLSWIGKGEQKHGVYFLETFKHDSWATVKVINAKGGLNSPYAEELSLHTGINKFRVRYVNSHGKIFFSNEVVYFANRAKISFLINDTENNLTFSAQTKYEIQNENRQVVMKGEGETVDYSQLVAGNYYVVYDNKIEKMSIK